MLVDAIQPPSAIEVLVRAHQHGLWRFVRWLGADPALADDLTQETLVRYLRAPAMPSAVVPTWLRTTARHLFLAARRRARDGVPLDDEVLLEEAWRRHAPDGGHRALAALDDCLARLPERSRGALDLQYRHQLPLAEIARALARSVSATKKLLATARAAIARCIADRREDEP